MEKVDIVIGVVGVVALLATGLGVAFYDEIDDLEEWHIRTYEADLAAQGQDGVGDAEEVEFAWGTPRNATGAILEITVTAQGSTPLDTGDVAVSLNLQGPGGLGQVAVTESFGIADGSATFTISASDWIKTPTDFEGDQADLEDRIFDWDEEFTLTVEVTGPGAFLPLPGFPVPTFDIDVTGAALVYEAVPDISDIEVI